MTMYTVHLDTYPQTVSFHKAISLLGLGLSPAIKDLARATSATGLGQKPNDFSLYSVLWRLWSILRPSSNFNYKFSPNMDKIRDIFSETQGRNSDFGPGFLQASLSVLNHLYNLIIAPQYRDTLVHPIKRMAYVRPPDTPLIWVKSQIPKIII